MNTLLLVAAATCVISTLVSCIVAGACVLAGRADREVEALFRDTSRPE